MAAAIDPFGLGRLAQSIRLNRQEERQNRLDEQNRVTRGMQDQLLQGQVQAQQGTLADLAQAKDLTKQAATGVPEGVNPIEHQYNLFAQHGRQDLIDKLLKTQEERVSLVTKQNPEAGTKLYNSTLASIPALNLPTIEHAGKSNYGEAFAARNKATNEIQYLVQNKDTGMFTPASGLEGFELIDKAGTKGEYAPSSLKKLINERQALLDEGVDPSDPTITAYDAKITGTDIDIEDMTDDEIDTWAAFLAVGGKLPSLGRGKQATKIRAKIAKATAKYALGADEAGSPNNPKRTPVEAALHMLGEQADTKSIQVSMNFLDKQLSSMGSFVVNLNSQVDKVTELSKDLTTYDTRLMNVPIRVLRGRILGSPLQAKYDMYLAEIEAEIGKLATGSTASVAELSVGAQERWSKIHDKNLSAPDMLELLEETSYAADLRLSSVKNELDKTRARMRREGRLPESTVVQTQPIKKPQTADDYLKSIGVQ